MSVTVVVPELLVEVRGVRTVREVAAASEGAFSHPMYWKWEQGLTRPTAEQTVALTKALGVAYERISLQIDKVPKGSKFFCK